MLDAEKKVRDLPHVIFSNVNGSTDDLGDVLDARNGDRKNVQIVNVQVVLQNQHNGALK